LPASLAVRALVAVQALLLELVSLPVQASLAAPAWLLVLASLAALA
jgi:hypothetical protein